MFNQTKRVRLSPSMMCADFLDLRGELDTASSEKVDLLHIDIMDGRYVPNFTFGPDLAYAMHEYSKIPLDFHLMIEDIDVNYALFTEYEGSTITFHPETSRHPVRTMEAIRDKGCRPGLAIDPGMSLETVKHLLKLTETVCVMTVNPGFSGQKLLPFCLEKIQELRDLRERSECDFTIEVDGNVSWDNIPNMIKVGADVLVLGTSSVFSAKAPRKEAYKKLRTILGTSLPAG